MRKNTTNIGPDRKIHEEGMLHVIIILRESNIFKPKKSCLAFDIAVGLRAQVLFFL